MNNRGTAGDAYQGVAGITLRFRSCFIGYQVYDYLVYDDGGEPIQQRRPNYLQKLCNSLEYAFNVNDDLSVSYGAWEAKKAGRSDKSAES